MRRVVTAVSGIIQDSGTPPVSVDVTIGFNGYQPGGGVVVGRSSPVANPRFPSSYDVLAILDDNYQPGLPAADYEGIAEASVRVPFAASDFETSNFLHIVQLPIADVPVNQNFRILIISNYDE
jgi:hypothetical protein